MLDRRTFLRYASASALSAVALRGASTPPPNIVLILCDDLGFGDLGCYGSKIPTPNIDGMAHEGVRFQQFYATSNVCSPSRSSLLTGRYQTRVGVPEVLASDATSGLSLSETTIAEMLKPAGYKTMCVGKWHLGQLPQYLPTRRGFDSYYGIPYSNDQTPSILLQNTAVVESPVDLTTLTQRYTQQAVSFIQRSKASPFFLYFPHSFPHIPLATSPAFRGVSGVGPYGDTVAEIDWSVGQILAALKSNGLDDNTLVMLTSDNGPWYQGSAGKLRGRKGSTYEGGVREPFIARFPGMIPAGRPTHPRVISSPATMMDILPTIASLTGATVPANPLDGQNIWPVLSGASSSVPRDIFLYFDGWNLQCARLGPWKLHVSRYNTFAYSPDPIGGSRINLPLSDPELYNLDMDPDESYDVAPQHPDIVAQIQARIQQVLPTFPPEAMNAWHATMTRKVVYTPDGALPVAQP